LDFLAHFQVRLIVSLENEQSLVGGVIEDWAGKLHRNEAIGDLNTLFPNAPSW
jgi:hypothetical protein